MESTTKMNKIVEEQKQEEEDQKEEAGDETNPKQEEEGEDRENKVEEELKQEDQKEEEGDETNPEQEEELGEDRFKSLESNLAVKLPSNNDPEPDPAGSCQTDGDDDHHDEEEEEEEGFKTPTGEEHKIPPMLECPSAPQRLGAWIRVRLARIVR